MLRYLTVRASRPVTVLALVLTSLAQDLSSTLVGCEDVACPQTDGHDYTCTVADDRFVGIGLARIPSVPDAYSGVSLVKGVNVSIAGPDQSTDDQDREYKSVYYFASPSGLDLTTLGGCAVVFHSTVGGPQFNGTNTAEDQGTCSDVISQSCIDALTDRARGFGSNDTSNACDSLRDDLKNNTIDACANLSGDGKGLGNFTVSPLSNLSPITSAQNGSSDCWPVSPKSDSLTKITEDTAKVRNSNPKYPNSMHVNLGHADSWL